MLLGKLYLIPFVGEQSPTFAWPFAKLTFKQIKCGLSVFLVFLVLPSIFLSHFFLRLSVFFIGTHIGPKSRTFSPISTDIHECDSKRTQVLAKPF